jgi:hypothetical protein
MAQIKNKTKTQIANTFAGGRIIDGDNQIADLLWEKLVPDCGDAPTEHGQALRWFTKIMNECNNNGGYNAKDADGYDGLTKFYYDACKFVANFAYEDGEACDKAYQLLRNTLKYSDRVYTSKRIQDRQEALAQVVYAKALQATLNKLTKPRDN